MIKERIFTVSEYLDILNETLKPCRAVVRGEVGEKMNNYPRYSFFNLLDKKDGSILRCFIWKEMIESLDVEIESGMEIKVVGYPEIRKERGELKFQVKRIELLGEGVLKRQYEIRKKKLAAQGYFDTEIKKQIPRFCENIGLITSRIGRGALKDFLTHLGNFGFRIFFYETKVEGSFAIEEITEAINWFNQNLPYIDVLVLIRGGGDWESLQPFNSEEIVKAIFASKIPVITGIGHEDDETLADLAADVRTSTPTHAAKILSENWNLASINILEFEKNLNFSTKRIFKGVKEKIVFFEGNLTSEMRGNILLKQKTLKNLMENLNLYFQNHFQEFEILTKGFEKNLFKIKILLKNQKQKVGKYLIEITQSRIKWRERIESILKQQEEKLFLSNPELKLKQGYTITFDKCGRIIKDPTKLKISQEIKTKFFKGRVCSKIKKIEN